MKRRSDEDQVSPFDRNINQEKGKKLASGFKLL